jgi:hypothetical protein
MDMTRSFGGKLQAAYINKNNPRSDKSESIRATALAKVREMVALEKSK